MQWEGMPRDPLEQGRKQSKTRKQSERNTQAMTYTNSAGQSVSIGLPRNVLAAAIERADTYLDDPAAYVGFGEDEPRQVRTQTRKPRRGARMVAAVIVAAFGIGCADVGTAPPATAEHSPRVRIPHCAEDEGFLVGLGNFDGSTWDRYQCVHPENLGPMAREDAGLARGLVEGICENPRFWKRAYGLTVMAEGCERAGARG